MNAFILALLTCNLGAAGWFAAQRNWPWVVIYVGAALIQGGSLWASR